MRNLAIVLLGICLAILGPGCGKKTDDSVAESIEFQPYAVEDSSRFVKYANGVSIYRVQEGPGDFPKAGRNIKIHYLGMLEDGTVFDSSYKRGMPLRFQLGDQQLIRGMEFAVGEMRYGSKAIVVIPPEKGYGIREDIPGIPPNSTLTFHLEVIGNI